MSVVNYIVGLGNQFSNLADPSGINGARRVAQMFKDAISGTQSLDLLWVGDSNTNFLGGSSASDTQGWCDAFQFALYAAGAPIYGTPLYTFHQNGSSSDERQGWRVKCDNLGTSLGGGGAGGFGINTDGVTTAQLLSGNSDGPAFVTNVFTRSLEFGPSYYPSNTYTTTKSLADKAAIDYVYYVNTGANYRDSIAGIYVDDDNPMGVANSLVYRCVHAMFASGGGSMKLQWWADPSPSPVSTTTISFAGTADEITASEVTLSSGARTDQVYAIWGGGDSRVNGLTAKAALLLQSVYRKVIGTASTPLCWWGGGTVQQISAGSTAVGTATLQTYLRELRNRQISGGGAGRVVVCFHGGANAGSQTPASWVADFQTFASNMRTAWSGLGYPAGDLGFLAMVSHVKDSGDTLNPIRTLCEQTFENHTDVLFVNLAKIVPESRMTSLALYDSGSIDGDSSYDVHMSARGYENAAMIAVERITSIA